MLRKEEILERTSNGLAIFKHYLPGNWRIGRNFLNPLYEDSKASCNIYFDRRSSIYKMKDFGNDSYSGDCFFLVGQLKGLDCNRAADFVEILEIIDRDLGLGLASGTPVSIPPATVHRTVSGKTEETPEKPVKPYQSGNRSSRLPNWCTGNSTASRPNCWNVTRFARSGSTTAKRQRANRTPTLHRWQNPCTATRANSISSCTARSPRPASSMAAASAKLLLRAGATASKRRHALYHGRRERRAFAGGTRFSRYLLQQRNGDYTAHAGISADIPIQAHRPAL